jgi:outer membrane lipoprotein-sorting protein
MMRALMVVMASALAWQPAEETSSPSLKARLEAFDAKTREIEDLSARFEQEKHSALLRKPLVSRGRVRVKGDVIRWDTREPIESVIHMDDRQARIYYPDQNSLEVYPLVADLRFLAGSPVPRMAELEEHFDITECESDGLEKAIAERADSLVVALKARDERLASRVSRIRLVLDERAGVMRLFELTDPSGERTLIRFTEIKVNLGLDVEDVALDTPAETKVSYPLGPVDLDDDAPDQDDPPRSESP